MTWFRKAKDFLMTKAKQAAKQVAELLEPEADGTDYSATFACAGCLMTFHESGIAPAGKTCVEARGELAEKNQICPACEGAATLIGFSWGNPADPTVTHNHRVAELDADKGCDDEARERRRKAAAKKKAAAAASSELTDPADPDATRSKEASALDDPPKDPGSEELT